MPWTEENFPLAMRNIDPRTRSKAIEIANALLREGHDEGFAIRVAIAPVHEWAQHDAASHPGSAVSRRAKGQ